MKKIFLDMISNFIASRTCMIWLVLFLTSTVLLIFGVADFTGWAAFNGGTSMLALIANKAEQKIFGPVTSKGAQSVDKD